MWIIICDWKTFVISIFFYCRLAEQNKYFFSILSENVFYILFLKLFYWFLKFICKNYMRKNTTWCSKYLFIHTCTYMHICICWLMLKSGSAYLSSEIFIFSLIRAFSFLEIFSNLYRNVQMYTRINFSCHFINLFYWYLMQSNNLQGWGCIIPA
jgi:hypothetical protein